MRTLALNKLTALMLMMIFYSHPSVSQQQSNCYLNSGATQKSCYIQLAQVGNEENHYIQRSNKAAKTENRKAMYTVYRIKCLNSRGQTALNACRQAIAINPNDSAVRNRKATLSNTLEPKSTPKKKALLTPQPVHQESGRTDPIEVRRVQELLNQLGFQVGVADGIAGNKTMRALKDFQKLTGVELPSIIDKELLMMLEDAVKQPEILAEIAFWKSVKESRNPEEFRAYVAEYPQGRFVSLARVRIKTLTAETGSGESSFDAAVRKAVNKVFSNAPKFVQGSARQSFVIDPLIDGLSGAESVATHAMESRIVELVHASYTQFDVRDFSASDLSESQYVVIGTFTGVNKQRKTSGVREGFRICLALLDLESGSVASKAKVFSLASGVDITPTPFFRESPVWLADPSIQAYVKTCQATKPGDPIDPIYLERLRAAAVINKAINAYEKGEYNESQKLFRSVSQSRGGNQLRTYNGLYLTSWKLGDRNQAEKALGKLVDFGLESGRFGVKFPFRPGSTDFMSDPNDAGEHDMWLAQIATQTMRREDCLEIVGHTHRLGPELLNHRLSIRQAEYIKRRLEAEAPELRARMIAAGRGSEQNLTGSGTGNDRDVFDRRIEFDVMQCSSTKQESADL